MPPLGTCGYLPPPRCSETRKRLITAHDWLLGLFAGDVDLIKITPEYLWSFLLGTSGSFWLERLDRLVWVRILGAHVVVSAGVQELLSAFHHWEEATVLREPSYGEHANLTRKGLLNPE